MHVVVFQDEGLREGAVAEDDVSESRHLPKWFLLKPLAT